MFDKDDFLFSFSSKENPLNFFKLSKFGYYLSKVLASIKILAAVSISVSCCTFNIWITLLIYSSALNVVSIYSIILKATKISAPDNK